MRRAKSILIRGLVFALLGVATTVAVAWGFALRGVKIGLPPNLRTHIRYMIISDEDALVFLPTKREFGQSSTHTWRWSISSLHDGSTVSEWALQHPPLVNPPRDRFVAALAMNNLLMRYERRLGFPFRALWCSTDTMSADWTQPGAFPSSGPHQYNHLVWLEDRKVNRTARAQSPTTGSRVPVLALPTGILPCGFALNTAFYAASWWMLIFGLSPARAWNRRRRGLCGRCAYDLRGLEPGAVCPECGRTLRTRATT